MIHQLTVLQALCGRSTYEAMVHTLYNQAGEFPEVYGRYTEAVAQLRMELGGNTDPSVDMLVTAIEMQCCSDMLFAGLQGLKMNYDHFLDPMRPDLTWPQRDFSEAWREELSPCLPMYRCAEAVIQDFYALLTGDQRVRLYAPICEYRSMLHAAAPRLAHYYGYKAGDVLLSLTVPSYHADPGLGLRYARLLEGYFDRPLDCSQWEGCLDLQSWKAAPIETREEGTDLALREAVWRYPHPFRAAG